MIVNCDFNKKTEETFLLELETKKEDVSLEGSFIIPTENDLDSVLVTKEGAYTLVQTETTNTCFVVHSKGKLTQIESMLQNKIIGQPITQKFNNLLNYCLDLSIDLKSSNLEEVYFKIINKYPCSLLEFKEVS